MFQSLNFVELRPFGQSWQKLKLTDEDLFVLQWDIVRRPDAAPVVSGTGGLRKLRFAPARLRKGKRGGVRVGYVLLNEHETVLLVIAYSKSEKDDLSPEEKSTIRQLIDRVKQEYASGLIR